jgi:SagB-type dehydrogenase family enzyme
MKHKNILSLFFFLLAAASLVLVTEKECAGMDGKEYISLPQPKLDGKMTVEQAIKARRSFRDYTLTPLTLEDISSLFWSAQGITGKNGLRAAPSAGAAYPVIAYIAVHNVQGMEPGLYRYLPKGHKLEKLFSKDLRDELASACLNQPCVRKAAASIILTARYSEITPTYGQRGILYTHFEIGHISENIYLEAESLGIGTVAVGAFVDEKVKKALSLPEDEVPLYIMPLGRRK